MYPHSASAVQEVALKETQELLKQERDEVATLKVRVFCVCLLTLSLGAGVRFQAQLDLAEQNKGSVDIEEIMQEKYVLALRIAVMLHY